MPEEKQVLFEPKVMYERMLKDQYHKGATEYFNELLTKSGVNEEENASLVRTLKDTEKRLANASKSLGGVLALRGFVIFLAVVTGLATIIGFYVGSRGNDIENSWIGFIVGGVSLALFVLFMVLLFTVIKKKVNEAKDAKDKAQSDKNRALADCEKNAASLNSLFDWGIPQKVMEKATPIIDLDPVFTGERLQYLKEKFGFNEVTAPGQSVLEVLSGQIEGNPFVLEKILDCTIGPKTYTGELTIYWTTTYRDSNGRTQTQQHSQTLHASVTKPAPYYSTLTQLVYGNEAAPHLHFSRKPVHAERMSQGERDRYIKKTIKKLDSKEAKDLEKSSNFTKLGNDEFDALFGAFNRDNEVEFRLLFTPLAIKNTIKLLKDAEPFGDDFHFTKDGMVNTIRSEHSQRFDYSSSPAYFFGYDVSVMRNKFVKYCDDFIKNLFFDLAPLLSIPLYQMHKPYEYIYETPYRSNFSSFEQEVLANGFDPSFFRPNLAGNDLPLILKAKSSQKRGSGDVVLIDAMSYQETPMTDYVSVHGGDGRWHNVPVDWIKYDEVHKSSKMGISNVEGTRNQYLKNKETGFGGRVNVLKTYFERGMMAIFEGDEDFKEELNNELIALFKD
ncbi:MAG: hypothetical protein MJ228_05435 [Bacilli bacterium]|nr:hypothetical protein [Bacilli bacterium]